MGNIFTLGGTAALAWELPHDPFGPFRKRAELLHRKDVLKPLHHVGWKKDKSHLATMNNGLTKIKNTMANMKWPSSSSYSTLKGLLNSFSNRVPFTPAITYKFSKPKQFPMTKQPITTYVDPVYHEVHRRTRRELFGKVEKLFKA